MKKNKMKDSDYLILQKMLEKNKRLFTNEKIDFIEYLENHEMIMKKIKEGIIGFENADYNFLMAIDIDECLDKFRKGIMVVNFNLN